MYEYSLTHSVNNALKLLCEKAGWKKIHRILLKVGGMKKVNPDLMTFLFAAASKDTPAEGAILSIMMLPVAVHCPVCNRIGIREDSEYLCPYCGSSNVDLLSGLELKIEVLEVESI